MGRKTIVGVAFSRQRAVGRPSGRAASITAWCSAVVGTVLITASALLSDRLVVPTVVAGLVLVAVGVFVVCAPAAGVTTVR